MMIRLKKKAWIAYMNKYKRNNPTKSKLHAKIASICQLKTIGIKLYDGHGKIIQIRDLLLKCNICNKGYGNFFYSIDEKCTPLLINRVIDNMPIDYSRIIDYSLNDLKDQAESIGNSISRQNIEIIEVLKEYITHLAARISNPITKGYLLGIIDKKAESVEEALQRILFINQILWQSKHTLNGFGRIDKLLEKFSITNTTENIIIDFFKTVHEFYNFKSNNILGDTGQLFIIGGKEINGQYYCNEYTYLFIKCLIKVALPDPKILLRVCNSTPQELIELAVDCISTGIGSPLISNDDVIIPALIDFGYSLEDAYNYGVSACWEPLAIGKSLEQNNISSIQFGRAAYNAISDEKICSCMSFESVISLFEEYVNDEINFTLESIDSIVWELDPILTLFTDGCLNNNSDISNGGSVYNNYGVLSEGMSTLINSLINIKNYCFEKELISLADLRNCILSNYEDNEKIKNCLIKNTNGFGSDSEYAVSLTNRFIKYTIEKISKYRNRFGGKVKFGLSSPNYLSYGKKTPATADGRSAFTPFATHISKDSSTLTEIANFASLLYYNGFNANANVVDAVVPQNLITDNKDKFVRYLQCVVGMGVFQLQFNVLSYKKLLEAKMNPEKYKSLVVRVWGFSAYFVDLPNEYKDYLINRAYEIERNKG